MLRSRQRGFNLIELMIVIAIISFLVVISLPSVAEMLQNSRTRSVAESLQNGIRFAQTEAARLSRLTTIEMTAAGAWTVTYVTLGTNDTLVNPLQSSPGGISEFVSITPTDTGKYALQFNDLGRVKEGASAAGSFSAITAAEAVFVVTNSKAPRRLSVRVSPSGKVRMCDPDKAFSSDPTGC